MISNREVVIFDTECYKNYWLLMFKHAITKKTRRFEIYNDSELDIRGIQNMLRQYCVVGFNSRNYDIPMISLAIKGATNAQLKAASDTIIQTNIKPWEFEREFNVYTPSHLDHIDLIEVAPGQAGLKLYAARMHSDMIQDLPIDPSATIFDEDRLNLITYCGYDLDDTYDLYKNRSDQLELRASLGQQYGQDLRSKSDAQIAEAVIKSELEKMSGKRIYKPDRIPKIFKYIPPKFISFKTQMMMDMLEKVIDANFTLVKGEVAMPEYLETAKIKIGSSTYTMGIGGLHSCEKSIAHFSDENYVLKDRDVRSYYPELILKNEFFPKHLGRNFLIVYGRIVAQRIAAKAAGDKVTSEALKITINGSFGKFGSQYSTLFSPDLLIQTTLTGQLALLMLIEDLELNGISVVSANTDGVVIKCPREKELLLEFLVYEWELKTQLVTEEVEYKALYSRDINNYIAIKTDGEVKLKGAYAPSGLAKNPTATISVDAVIEYLKNTTPIEDTIERCEDPKKFLVARQVNGGAIAYRDDILPKNTTKTFMRAELSKTTDISMLEVPLEVAYEQLRQESVEAESKYLGKVVRWYYTKECRPPLRYKTNGNKVSMSDNAQPMMKLLDYIPDDVDLNRYAQIANEILQDIGAIAKPKPPEKRKTKKQLKLELEAFVKEFDEEEL